MTAEAASIFLEEQVQDRVATDCTELEIEAAWLEGHRLGANLPGKSILPDWKTGIDEGLAEAERQIVRQCIFYASKARGFAARGEMHESIRLFAAARIHASNPALGPMARLSCVSELEAAEAYLDFVCGDMGEAEQKLVRSMQADEALEERFDEIDLHVHRVHLANNVVKVLAADGRLAEALALARQILSYVAGTLDDLPLPTRWGAYQRRGFDHRHIRFLHRQTTVEVACAMAGLWGDSALALWDQELKSEALPLDSMPDRDIRYWYRLKRDFLLASTGEPAALDAYKSALVHYLQSGPVGSRTLWDLASFDSLVLQFCVPSEAPWFVGPACCKRIGDYLRQATYLPRHVAEKIERLLR